MSECGQRIIDLMEKAGLTKKDLNTTNKSIETEQESNCSSITKKHVDAFRRRADMIIRLVNKCHEEAGNSDQRFGILCHE